MNTGLPYLLFLVTIFILIAFGSQLKSFYRKLVPIPDPYEPLVFTQAFDTFDVIKGNISYLKLYEYRRHIKKGNWQIKVEKKVYISEDRKGNIIIDFTCRWQDVPDWDKGYLEYLRRVKKEQKKTP